MGALSSLATTGLNLALAQQAAGRQSRDINNERDRRIQELQARNREEDRRRREELRRRLAAERARAGAAGVATRGGSSDAVLRGLVQEAGAAERAADATVRRSVGEVRRNASSARRSSLLDLTGGVVGGLLGGSGRSSLLDF
jgi:regulator of protease activity HflC (stomatin/prohibitin superfamily)